MFEVHIIFNINWLQNFKRFFNLFRQIQPSAADQLLLLLLSTLLTRLLKPFGSLTGICIQAYFFGGLRLLAKGKNRQKLSFWIFIEFLRR